jgi:hypothetical protein
MNEIKIIKNQICGNKFKTNGKKNNMRDHSVKTIVGG